MNSTTHGCYANNIHPIQRGPFKEDPEELTTFVDEVITDLAPRDLIERTVARRVAELLVKVERASRLESAALASATSPYPMTPSVNGDEEYDDGERARTALAEVYPLTLRIDSGHSRRLKEAFALYERLQQRHLPDEVELGDPDLDAKRTQSDEQPPPDNEDV